MRLIKFFVRKKVDNQQVMRSTSKQIAMLGKLYSIKIMEGKRNKVVVNEDHLEVTLFPATVVNFENYLSGWYRRQARNVFYEAVNRWLLEFDRLDYDVPYPQLKLFMMRRAWGRCYYTKKVITVNLRLFSMPKECIDYIMLHELTHFVAHDHGQLFYAILEKIDPTWARKEALLRQLEGTMKQPV